MMTYLYRIRNIITEKLGWIFCEISFRSMLKWKNESFSLFFYSIGVWFYSLYKNINNEEFMLNDGFYNWIFHFNPYTQLWSIIHREDYTAYWSGGETKYPVVKSKDLKTLIYVVNTSEGDPSFIEEIIDLAVKE